MTFQEVTVQHPREDYPIVTTILSPTVLVFVNVITNKTKSQNMQALIILLRFQRENKTNSWVNIKGGSDTNVLFPNWFLICQ